MAGDDQLDATGTAERIQARPWRHLFPRVIWAAVLIGGALYVVISGEVTQWITPVAYIALAGTQLVQPVGRALAARRLPWAVQIGPEGIVWQPTLAQVGWPSVAQIRVSRTWWGRLVRPGVRLVNHWEADFADRVKGRPTSFVIDTPHLDATREQVLAMIRRHADVPVVED